VTTLHDIWTSLHDSDFAAGVRMLTPHGGGSLTRKAWARLQSLAIGSDSVDDYSRGKLGSALKGLPAGATPAAPRPVPPIAKDDAAAATGIPGTLTSDRAKALHKEHAYTHALLVNATTDRDRARLAHEIMALVQEIDTEYDRLRADAEPAPEEEEEMPAIHPILNRQDADDLRRLQSLRSRISALKKKIPKEKDETRRKVLQKQLDENIIERDILQKKLST
jgi:hypothetical protein